MSIPTRSSFHSQTGVAVATDGSGPMDCKRDVGSAFCSVFFCTCAMGGDERSAYVAARQKYQGSNLGLVGRIIIIINNQKSRHTCLRTISQHCVALNHSLRLGYRAFAKTHRSTSRSVWAYMTMFTSLCSREIFRDPSVCLQSRGKRRDVALGQSLNVVTEATCQSTFSG